MGIIGRIRGEKKCSQCGKPATLKVKRGVHLCVDCYNRLLEADGRRRIDALDMLHRSNNQLLGMMETVAGMPPGFYPRHEVREPAPVIQTGPVTQNITIKDNAIGVLNTGTIHSLDVSVGVLGAAGRGDMAAALKEFVEAAANDESISRDDRDELLEDVDMLMGVIGAPAEQRRLGLARTVIKRVTEIAAGINAVALAWDRLEPLVRHVLQLT